MNIEEGSRVWLLCAYGNFPLTNTGIPSYLGH